MSVPQQLHGQSAVAFQLQDPSALDPSALKGGNVDTTPVKFDIRGVTKHRVSNYLLALDPRQTKDLALATCEASRELQGDQWNKSNLVKDLKKHDLPRNFSHRSGHNEDKLSAVLNLFKGVQEEATKAKEDDDLSKAEKLKNLLQDPASVFVGGRTLFIQQMEKYESEVKGSPQAGNGSPTQGSQGVKGPGLSPAENPLFEGSQKPPLPLGGAPTNEPSAPPSYYAVQAEKMAESQVESLESWFIGVSFQITVLQQGLETDFQNPAFKSAMNWVDVEFSRIPLQSVPENLKEKYTEAKAKFDVLQKQQRVSCEMLLVKGYHEKMDTLELLDGKERKQENLLDVKAIERELESIDRQIGDLSSLVEDQKKALHDRVEASKAHIGEWKTCVAALETIKNMTSDLSGFAYQKSPQDIEAFSKRLNTLDDLIRRVPSGEGRTDLMKQSSKLRDEFTEIQQKVKKQQLIDELEKAEKNIKALEHETSGNPEPYLVEQASLALVTARPLVVDEGRDEYLAKLNSLMKRLAKFESQAGAGQTAASKMQSAVQGDVKALITSIDTLIDEAGSRLNGAEKMRKVVAGAPLNQTHMDEIQGFLDQISEEILRIKGLDNRAERDRLQTMNATLLYRWTELRGGGANNGQSIAASTQPESGNEGQTKVDKITTALDEAEAPIDALASNPNSPNKNDLHTQAKGKLEKATLMLGKLTDPAFKPQRAELNAKLTNLTDRLAALERSNNQGQGLSETKVLQLNRKFLRGIADDLNTRNIDSLIFLIDIPYRHQEQITHSADGSIKLLEYLESKVTVTEMIEFMELIGRCDIATRIREYQDNASSDSGNT